MPWPQEHTASTVSPPDFPMTPADVNPIGIMILMMIGMIAAVAKILLSKNKITVREVCGRILWGGILSLGASATPLMFPSASTFMLCGVAAALAVMGDSVVIAIMRKRFGVEDEPANDATPSSPDTTTT